MKSILITLYILLISAVVVSASTVQPMAWRRDGKPVPNEDARKSVNGFGAALIITPDADWKEKWNTPSYTSPRFSTVDKLKIGDKATVLIFFANPKKDTSGIVNISCNVKVTRPNKKVTENKGLSCFSGQLRGPVTNTYLSELTIDFVGEPSDPIGEWIFEVTVNDINSHISIPLLSKIQLVK